ncbi:MAG: site-2 protease family protein [Acidimicrobiia bacterium]|nr:site-2 protease family protein [Acidimicrobiia bacterium]
MTPTMIPDPVKGFANFRASPFWALATALVLLVSVLWAQKFLYLLGFLAVIILVHEAGHWFVARRAGMRPTEFFWGFGPEIVGVDFNGCRYGVKAVFLGGYVKLWGMTPTSELPDGIDESDTYRSASHAGRLATILAGPFTNIALALLVFSLARYIETGVFAWADGLSYLRDVVVGTSQALWGFATNPQTYVGAMFADEAAGAQVPNRFVSPLAQAEISQYAVRSGLVVSLLWFGILNAAVGFVNLLPLPPLDGSHALVTITERSRQLVQRDRSVTVNVARLEPLAYLTIAALVLLTVNALVLDIRFGIGI